MSCLTSSASARSHLPHTQGNHLSYSSVSGLPSLRLWSNYEMFYSTMQAQTTMSFENQNDEMMSGYVGQDQMNISQQSRERGHYVTLIAPIGTIYAQKLTGTLIWIHGQLSRRWPSRTISFLPCSCLYVVSGLPFGPSLAKPGSRVWTTFHLHTFIYVLKAVE